MTSTSLPAKSKTCRLQNKPKHLISVHLLLRKNVRSAPTHAENKPITVTNQVPFFCMKSGGSSLIALMRSNASPVKVAASVIYNLKLYFLSQSLYLALGCLALYSSAFSLPSRKVIRFLYVSSVVEISLVFVTILPFSRTFSVSM